MIHARFKRTRGNPRLWLVLCGKADERGNKTCPGTFGVAQGGTWGGSGPPVMRMYGLLRPDARGVYRLSRRHLDQIAQGKAPTLRRSQVHDPTVQPATDERWAMLDYGSQGERAGELIRAFPILAACPRCQCPNEIMPPGGLDNVRA